MVRANHHNRFRFIERSDHDFLFLNVLFLMCVAFIPFPTALLAEYMTQADYRVTAVAVYAGTLLATAIFFTLLWLYAASNRRLVARSLSPETLNTMNRRFVVGLISYVIAFALALVSPILSLALIVGLALLFVLPEPKERPPKQPRETRRSA